jgi:stage II sporulation protein D
MDSMDEQMQTEVQAVETVEATPEVLNESEETALVESPKPAKAKQFFTWLKQRPGATVRWVGARPWLGLPLLAAFPAVAWHLDRNRPPEAKPPVEVYSNRPTASSTPLAALMQPTNTLPLTVPGAPSPNPTTSPNPNASPTPVDLTKLTPEQKAMNAKAKAALLGAASLVDAQIEMHVAIATKAPGVAVGSPSSVEVSDAEGKVIYKLAAGEMYTAQPVNSGIALGDQTLPNVIFLNSPETGILMVSGRAYRGKLRLVSKEGALWAISHVNMRNYLQSVVASEVSPNWGKESLKAQAIAARSYALTYYFKPANPLYHLGNDEYYQVYSGIEREAPETNNAVDETSGEFVSYKGGIVESLYAASDDIVAEAFAGKGMSQLGAKDLASQGYKYEQILGHYYPGTAVAKIVQEF